MEMKYSDNVHENKNNGGITRINFYERALFALGYGSPVDFEKRVRKMTIENEIKFRRTVNKVAAEIRNAYNEGLFSGVVGSNK